MIDNAWKLLIFVKDFTGRGNDQFYWLEDDVLVETRAEDVVNFADAVVCHDFWMIRDVLFDQTGDLPGQIIDLDEFRIAISGIPEDRQLRETRDITIHLEKYGATPEICSNYKKIFNKGIEFDAGVACKAAQAMAKMFLALCVEAVKNDESERFYTVEIPVYRILQSAMSKGIKIDTTRLSQMRKEAEYDYFFCLKSYSVKHDMPLETPTKADIEEKLNQLGFDLSGVSSEYVLEFLPHNDDFGNETLNLRDFDVARRVLSSLFLSSDCARPIVDVFGSRTSRVFLRSPSLQNMPKKFRTIIVPNEGAELCYVDFDQFEVGIMAALSGDKELAALFAAGDMYELFATDHLGLVGNRKAAKQLFLSYAYGMSRKALIDAAVSLGAVRDQAKDAFNRFSRYEEWKREVWRDFQDRGRVATVLGNHYRRSTGGPLSGKEQRSAVSQVVQGTASLIFKKAILEVGKLKDVAIVLPMHDALLFEHRAKETPELVVKAFENVMTEQLGKKVNGKASIDQFVVGG